LKQIKVPLLHWYGNHIEKDGSLPNLVLSPLPLPLYFGKLCRVTANCMKGKLEFCAEFRTWEHHAMILPLRGKLPFSDFKRKCIP
jgi:hypothetical protein